MEKANSISVTLFLPGLMHYRDNVFRELVRELPPQQQRLPALELIVARCENVIQQARDFHGALFELFHLPVPAGNDIPVGALSHYLETGENSGCWYMRADPVYLQPNRDHLLLLGNEMIDIGANEARQLVDDINTTYQDTAWRMKMLSARHWVLELDQAPLLRTTPLNEVTGKNISSYMPQGEDATTWHALMNELQMFMYSHPLNRHREMQGQLAMNSVWLWGSGKLPEVTRNDHRDYVQCWSSHVTVQALAKLCGIPRTDLPANADSWLKYAITPGHHLLVIEDLNMPVAMLDPYDWWQSLCTVEHQWLQPLLDALRSGKLARLVLVSDTGERFTLTASASKRWWKRIKALV